MRLKALTKNKIYKLFDYAVQDPFFEPIVHDLVDFGHDIRFSMFGGAGAYQPHALLTECLGTQEKVDLFHKNLSLKFGSEGMLARIRLNRFASDGAVMHSFLHEVMHFYQDMHGLFFTPLEEESVFPIILDAKSSILATLFNEAWAEVEALRTLYSLKRKHNLVLWPAALKHRDFGFLAEHYEREINSGVDEARAAANIFVLWYSGKHRSFYELHARSIYQKNFARYEEYSAFDVERLRTLELPMLVARLPKGAVPKYFNHFDWNADVFQPQINIDAPEADNNNVQDIKCGSPPYLWHRLRLAGVDDLKL